MLLLTEGLKEPEMILRSTLTSVNLISSEGIDIEILVMEARSKWNEK